jgi:hypothetical protein
VDLALLALGVTLVAVQVGEASKALWTFANLALTARNDDDLRQAASSLAWAVSKIGVNVVAFVLTKKMASKAARPRAPPNEPPAVTPEGMVGPQVGAAAPARSSTAAATAASGVLSQGSGRPAGTEHASAPKKVDPETFATWIEKAPKTTVRGNSPAAQYQRKHAGAEEVTVSGGGVEARADGARARDAHLLEVKHVDNPGASPYVPGSSCPEPVRRQIREELIQQFRRYAAVIGDPATPAVGLELITNDSRAGAFFSALMAESGVQGGVVVRP